MIYIVLFLFIAFGYAEMFLCLEAFQKNVRAIYATTI